MTAADEVSKSQLAKIKERFETLSDQLRRTTMLLKNREKSFLELEDKYAQLERDYEIEKEKNIRLEEQFKESMEGTLDVDAIKNVTILNAQIASLKKELVDTQAKLTKLKSDTALKIKALQDGLQDEMTKATHAKTELETQLLQLQEERVRYASFNETLEKMTKELEEQKSKAESLKLQLEKETQIFEQKSADWENQGREFQKEMELRNKKEEEFLELIESLKNENERLFQISKVFDVITLEAEMLDFQDEVQHAVKHPEQKELVRKLEKVELLKTKIDLFEKMTADRVANYFNMLMELESVLKNHILLEE